MNTIFDDLNKLAEFLDRGALRAVNNDVAKVYEQHAATVRRTGEILLDLMTPASRNPIHVECLPGSEPCIVDSPISQPGEEPIEIDDTQQPGSERVGE